MSKASAIFGWARLLAPLILANVPATRPLASHIGGMIDEAEAIKTATGRDKLTHVLQLAHATADGINQEKPGLIDPDALDSAITSGIDVAFSVAKLVADSHGAPAEPPAVAIVPGALVVPPAPLIS